MLNKTYVAVRNLLLTIFTLSLLLSGAWGQTFKVLHSFGASGDGQWPQGGVVFDSHGNLYGVTEVGPSGNGCLGEGCGTVYQLKPNGDGTWAESVIHAFNGNDAAFPFSSPVFDAQGKLYGTADGHAGAGTFPAIVYQLTPGSNGTWTESILYQFPSSPDNQPGAVTLDSAGNVYGVADAGGVNQSGYIYRLNRASGWQEQFLLFFDQTYPYLSGLSPQGPITFDDNGNLYVATILGGTYGCGVVFKLTGQGSFFWKETVLHDFACGADGYYPVGATFGPDGSLYAVTQIGGISRADQCPFGCGTVFKLTPNADGAWTKTTLYAFHGGQNDGAFPVDGLVFDQAGNIYSTTDAGGNSSCSSGCGTVFKLTPSSGGQYTESILHFFTGGSDGSVPISTMASDGAGNLYGATYRGGTYGDGVAFEITP